MQQRIELPNIANLVEGFFGDQIKQYPVTSIYASELGHPCPRYLCYRQVAWRRQKKITPRLKMLFQVGNEHGEAVVRILQDAFRDNQQWRSTLVEQMEVPLPENDDGVHGRIDCVLKFPMNTETERMSCYIPTEVKGMADATYNKINSVQDMLTDPATYVNKYPAQLTMYCHYAEVPHGLFVWRNKQTGAIKGIPLDYDPKYAEGLVKKARLVKRSVEKFKRAKTDEGKEKSLPDRIKWRGRVCGRCDFLGVCLPDMDQTAGIENLLGDTELHDCLVNRMECLEASKVFKKADKELKDHLKTICDEMEVGETKTLLLPSFDVEVKIQGMTQYPVPEDVKKKYKKEISFPKLTKVTPKK